MSNKFINTLDLDFIHSVTRELVNDVVETPVVIYQVDKSNTTYNIYGEVEESGFVYKKGVSIGCLINKQIPNTTYENGVVNRTQTIDFRFHRESLREHNLYPMEGDIINFNDAYYEISVIVDNQFIGGRPNMQNKHSIACTGVLVPRNKTELDILLQ